ncbi:MAG: SRPBCC family protein [Actinomycetes bacterium]|nr:SRPBCC family protein [Actinomycetes bacterium]
MKTLVRTVTTTAPPEKVFPYLVDFTNATEWDAGTVSCTRLSGDGGVGTRYRNVSKFAGREVELIYTTEKVEEPTFVIKGSNNTTTSEDIIVVRPEGTGSEVTYTAKFTFSGVGRFFEPFLGPFLNGLGDDLVPSMKTALDRL